MDDNGFISSVLLCSDDLIDEIDHPRPCAWSSTLWPRGEVKLLNHSVLAVSRLYCTSTEIKVVRRLHVGWLPEQQCKHCSVQGSAKVSQYECGLSSVACGHMMGSAMEIQMKSHLPPNNSCKGSVVHILLLVSDWPQGSAA